MTAALTLEVWPILKLIGFLVLVVLAWAIKSSWSEEDKCRDCNRCTESILTRAWKGPTWGLPRAVERLWLRTCPTCKHRLVQDHGIGDDGRFLD